MSSLGPRCLALVAAALLAAPSTARGQLTEQELVQHLDTLLPLLRAAREQAGEARRAWLLAQERQVETTPLQVGPLKVLAIPGREDLARDVVGRVFEREYATWLDASPTLATRSIFFDWSADDVDYRPATLDIARVQGPRWRTRAYMEAGVRQVISEALKRDLLATAMGREWFVNEMKTPDPGATYRQVALAPSRAVHDCLGGDDAACLRSFGLGPEGVSPSDLYAAGERALLVQQNVGVLIGTADGESLERCRRGEAPACDRVLADYWSALPPSPGGLWVLPFGAEVRASLLWYALERGGPGAWTRLLEHADGPPLGALEAASGLQGPELVAGWRASILEARPVRQAGLGPLTLGTLLWTILLIALAARSTRWRLG